MMSMTGNGTSLSKPGVPDVGLITMPEMVENAAKIQSTVDVPVLADADNGYGNALNARRTVREFITAGVAGVHLEDQVFPKRCGFVDGKRVISKAEAVGKFEAIVDVRNELDPEFVIVARTDARSARNGTLDDAIERVNAYCDAGADVGFVQGAENREEVARIAAEVDAPLLYNRSASSPRVPIPELDRLGYAMVMVPRLSTLATIIGVHKAASELENDGLEAYTRLQESFEELPYDGFDDFAGVDEMIELESTFVPESEKSE